MAIYLKHIANNKEFWSKYCDNRIHYNMDEIIPSEVQVTKRMRARSRASSFQQGSNSIISIMERDDESELPVRTTPLGMIAPINYRRRGTVDIIERWRPPVHAALEPRRFSTIGGVSDNLSSANLVDADSLSTTNYLQVNNADNSFDSKSSKDTNLKLSQQSASTGSLDSSERVILGLRSICNNTDSSLDFLDNK
jgi:hypothetical protein